ncbi:MAG: response regulator, partial [Candidatus Electrothrix sp. AR3]|nr:response regulator [Candidatus Electrothrix sp. AR3]
IGQIRQVLINLIGNAIKFINTGRVTFQVKVLDSCPDKVPATVRVAFIINDTGPGIPEDRQKTIFEAFEQSYKDGSQYSGGTGLGLSIALQLVRMMDSTIELKSSEGQGSRFSFILNLLTTGQQPDKTSSSCKKKSHPPSKSYAIEGNLPLTILLVDDIEANRLLARHLMEERGWQVEEAVNGREAIDMISKRNFHLVLMDVEMPILDGIEATKILRHRETAEGLEHLPIIALTAHALRGDRERILASGMDDYISKPFVPDNFFTAIERQISRY